MTILPHFLGLSTNGKSISPRERILTYLWYLGTNLQHKHTGVSLGLSEGSVAESVGIVNDIMFKHLVPKYIRVPTEEEARYEARLFSELSDMPEIIWASIDGTHIEGTYLCFLVSCSICSSLHSDIFASLSFSLLSSLTNYNQNMVVLSYQLCLISLSFACCSDLLKQSY